MVIVIIMMMMIMLLSISLSSKVSRLPRTYQENCNKNTISVIKSIGTIASVYSLSKTKAVAATSSGINSNIKSNINNNINSNINSNINNNINSNINSNINNNINSNINSNRIMTTTISTSNSNEADEFWNGLVSGAVSRTAKELLLHPLDTVRARQQVNNNTNIFNDLYSGITPALIGGIPAGAAFFAFKDYSKSKLRKLGLSKEEATLLSVAIANIPYWIIRTPSEVIKTQEQIGTKYQYMDTLKQYIKDPEPIIQSYNSFASNYIYALPTDIIKFVAYESLKTTIYNKNENEKIEGLEAAITGAIAGLIAQLSTTPLDVIRTRIMADLNNEKGDNNVVNKAKSILEEEGYLAFISGLSPRILRALASGAIQFTSYELTQNVLRVK
jgi:solute carrier family 25 S-adenosylmethionine transporter 26